MPLQTRYINQLSSSPRRISSSNTFSSSTKSNIIYSKCELDSHADTTVAGANCIILSYTGKECDVSPYRDDYESIKNIPIVTAATAWQSPSSGATYILILNESLWMGDSMKTTLINPNQLRHYGVQVQDNPMSHLPLSIVTEDNEFSMNLSMAGTIVFAETHTPTDHELETCPHIELTSPQPWDPFNVRFPHPTITLEEMMDDKRHVSSTTTTFDPFNSQSDYDLNDIQNHTIFDLDAIQRKICTMYTTHIPVTKDIDIDNGTTDVPITHTFQSSERHSDVSAESLSERWGISLATASKTLKNTTQRFLRSAILPLGRRYRQDRLFTRKTLHGDWATDTLDGRCKSLDGNKYAQVFTNKAYFSKIYPMDSKTKAGDALRVFCNEFGVPERLTFDGSKEQCMPGTKFMKQIRTHNIQYHISEADLHNQNPAEGVIGEIRRKWYRLMVRVRAPPQLWDYGMKYICEISSLTYTQAGSLQGGIPLCQVTGETPDISEYLDFSFYDPIWYKDNAGASPFEPGRWLGVSVTTGRLMTYHVLTKKGTVLSRSTVQRVTTLELSTENVKKIFTEFDASIDAKFKSKPSSFQGDKPNPEDWADLFSEDQDFVDEFRKIFNDNSIKEADEYTEETLDDTYLNMEIALPRDSEGPEYAKVTKRLRDANGIPIGTANDNPMLDTRLYEVEYLDGYTTASENRVKYT